MVRIPPTLVETTIVKLKIKSNSIVLRRELRIKVVDPLAIAKNINNAYSSMN